MNLALALKIAEIIGILLGTIAFALVTYWRLKEKVLSKEHGMLDNPERCRDHEERLRKIETIAIKLDAKVEGMKEDVDGIIRKLEALGK